MAAEPNRALKVLRDLSQNLPKQARYRKSLWNALEFSIEREDLMKNYFKKTIKHSIQTSWSVNKNIVYINRLCLSMSDASLIYSLSLQVTGENKSQ